MLKFISYFTVFNELSRRVGAGFFESTKFFKPPPPPGEELGRNRALYDSTI